MEVDKLVSLEGEELDNQFGWIDWRQNDTEVIEIIKSQLPDGFSIDYMERDGGITIHYSGGSFSIPLTHTGCDRYITINSLAEIIGDTHDVWLHKRAMEDDTHGVLVLPKDHSDELVRNHASWVNNNLQALKKGVDEFSGLTITYVGHEDNAPGLANELRAREARDVRIRESYQQSEGAIRKFRYKSYMSLVIPGLIILVIAWLLILKYQQPDCRVRMDGECLVYSRD